ncbi:hypothetical protein Dsin_031444 [Dipteronia sinensis]|uniref:Uncharacterized protein n=1 Tax=Dipteronia sinensis TaxID=43782 RepID=A0AAE0DS72_9ROSI|nr:hypothetical protein Dsin_031444 [Dipteronia sinensis]
MVRYSRSLVYNSRLFLFFQESFHTYVSYINVILAIVFVADTSWKAKIGRRAWELLPEELVLLEEVFLFSVYVMSCLSSVWGEFGVTGACSFHLLSCGSDLGWSRLVAYYHSCFSF